MIPANWFFFIWSVQVGRALEASLGYYIYPLVAILIGLVVFKERLTRLHWMAVVLALIGVVILTIGLGVVPMFALILAVTFGLYGMVKKQINVGPVVSVTVEVLILVPIAVGFLIYTYTQGQGQFGRSGFDSVILALSGPMTAIPLILFGYATKRIAMATVGVL